MSFTPATSCLLLIDFQCRLLPAIIDAGTIVANAGRLARSALLLQIPVLSTEQNRDGLGETAAELKSFSRATLPKRHFDATRETEWTGFVPQDRKHIIVAGCETHVCVLQTVMGLLKIGHAVRLVCDAVGSRTLANRDAGLHRAERLGAELVTTEMVIFEWLGSCDHLAFREALKLIK
jgi:nicotinamidase-related amidase